MTFDTHLSMTTHKMGEYWFSEEVKFQCLRNTSGIAVKLSEWTHDVGVVTKNIVFVGELWRTSYTKKKPTSPVHCQTMMSTLIYRRAQKTSRTLIHIDTDRNYSAEYITATVAKVEHYIMYRCNNVMPKGSN